ncbi:hypothetical protein MRB53_035672 [Persea americana]|uniref:Uncharacterized protein n=3 Tax=Persea americana TaxID=3435 RepID=A0ACC2K5A2_PERAE|nr:hypothetical protein MRB53_035672 [Persea americana]
MKGSKEMTKIGFFLLLALAFLLLFIMGDCHVTGTQVNHVDSILELDPKDVPLSKDGNVSDANLGKGPPNVDSPKVEQGKNGKVQNDIQLENRVDTDSKKNDSSKDLDSKQNHNVEEDKKSENKKSGLDGKNKKSDSMNEGLGSKAVPGEDTKDGESDLSKSLRKENPQLEECDVSNSCVDEKKKLVACLRVPGNGM